MANVNIRKPRFYVDLINFLKNRDQFGGHTGIETSGSDQIDVVSGSSIDELYDMRPLNQVEFNTTGNRTGHVNLWIDTKSSSWRVDFVAILNHNMIQADAKIRISSSDGSDTDGNGTIDVSGKTHVKSVDHEDTASSTQANNQQTLVNQIGIQNISTNTAKPDSTNSWGSGHAIITFPQATDRYWGIQFEGSTNSADNGDGAYFDASENLKIGCILLGQFYDMPHSPDLSVKRSIDFDGVKVQESLGGQRFSTMTQHGRRNIETANRSPFTTHYNSFGAFGGRMSYDMKFSYLNSTDVMPNNYDTHGLDDDAVIEDVWNKTNGRHTPFIFTQDGTSGDYSDYLFARFGQDSLNMTQVAPDVFDVSMKIEEEF